jgi:type VI secretion system protein VasD
MIRKKKMPISAIFVVILVAACSSASKNTSLALPFPAGGPTDVRRADGTAGFAHGPEDYALKGVADALLNRDINGQSLSVVVRLYQLSGKTEFTRLTFDAVASGRSDTELFPKELVAANEVVLVPADTQEITDKLLPETRYVGMVGFFRRPDTQNWRFLVDARAVRNEGLNFAVRDCYFAAIQPKPEPIPGQSAGYTPECAMSVPSNRSRR